MCEGIDKIHTASIIINNSNYKKMLIFTQKCMTLFFINP